MSRTLDYLFDRNVAWAWSKTQDDPRFFRRMAHAVRANRARRDTATGCSCPAAAEERA
jgi:hypothetical protein